MGVIAPNYHVVVVGSTAEDFRSEHGPVANWGLMLNWFMVDARGIILQQLQHFLKSNIAEWENVAEGGVNPRPRLGFLIHMIVVLPQIEIGEELLNLALAEEIVVVIGNVGKGDVDSPEAWESRMRSRQPIRLASFREDNITDLIALARKVQNVPNPWAQLPP